MGLFGPSKREVWEQLCRETQATYVKGGFIKTAKVEYKYGLWLIVLDEYTVSTGKSSATYTRIRAPFIPREHFQFHIYRKGVFSGIAKAFGAQDIATGDELFDEMYIVKSDDDWQVRRLLDDEVLRVRLLAQKSFSLHNRPQGFFLSPVKLPPGAEQLEFQIGGVIRDAARLKELFTIFALVLDGLCKMNAITNEGVAVEY